MSLNCRSHLQLPCWPAAGRCLRRHVPRITPHLLDTKQSSISQGSNCAMLRDVPRGKVSPSFKATFKVEVALVCRSVSL